MNFVKSTQSMQQQECVGDIGQFDLNPNGKHWQFHEMLLRNVVKLSTEQPIRHHQINQRKTLLGKQHQQQIHEMSSQC